jgi:hypothetical protein
MNKRKKSSRYGVPPEIDLTDGLPRVVSRRPVKNRRWRMFTFPFRFMVSMFRWVMETDGKSKAQKRRLKRIPQGFE